MKVQFVLKRDQFNKGHPDLGAGLQSHESDVHVFISDPDPQAVSLQSQLVLEQIRLLVAVPTQGSWQMFSEELSDGAFASMTLEHVPQEEPVHPDDQDVDARLDELVVAPEDGFVSKLDVHHLRTMRWFHFHHFDLVLINT